MSAIPSMVILAVKARSAGLCEACSWPLGGDGGVMHHRLLRSRGGPHTVANLMEIHPRCHNGHTNSIHSRVERSERLHHILPSRTDPDSAPPPIVTWNLLDLVA